MIIARTYVLIFFFWAVLTVITPTLIFLSQNSKLAFADSSSEKSGEIKTRKMMGHSEEDSMRTLMALVKMLQEVASSGASATPAPAPALGSSVGIHEKRRDQQQDYISKKDVIMYKEIVAQMLFEV